MQLPSLSKPDQLSVLGASSAPGMWSSGTDGTKPLPAPCRILPHNLQESALGIFLYNSSRWSEDMNA